MFWTVILIIILLLIFQVVQSNYISARLDDLANSLNGHLNNKSLRSLTALPITIENQYQGYDFKISYGYPNASGYNLGPTIGNNYIQIEFFRQAKIGKKFKAYSADTKGMFYKQIFKVGDPKNRINISNKKYILLPYKESENGIDKSAFRNEEINLIDKMLDYFDEIFCDDGKIVGKIYPCLANANQNIKYDNVILILNCLIQL